jgi:hypothetical protein
VHMLISIPPQYAVAQVIGYIRGKSAIHIARTAGGRQRNFTGEHFWARGYFVSAVGRDEKAIREYIQRQEEEDRRLDQGKMGGLLTGSCHTPLTETLRAYTRFGHEKGSTQAGPMDRQHLACLPCRLISCGDFSPNSLSSLALRPDDSTHRTAFQPGRSKEPTPRSESSNAKPTAFATPNSSNSRSTACTKPAMS